MFKGIFKSVGAIVWFVAMQFIGTIGILIFKFCTDDTWVNGIINSIESSNYNEYFALFSEILPPALILADLLIIIPMLLRMLKNKEQIVQKISYTETTLIVTLAISLNAIVSFIISCLPASEELSYYNDLISNVTNMGFVPMLITTGFLAPVVEELLFRYLMINSLKENGIKKAIIISSLLFGITHLNLIQSTYAFLFGIVLGLLYVKDDSFNLAKPILFHIVVNTSSVLYEFAPQWLKYIFISIAIISVAVSVFFVLSKDKNKQLFKIEQP